MQELVGKVALVTRGGEDVGRAIALALAARGVRIVVTGPDERAVAETVGEIAYGGGKARHVAGDPRDAAPAQSAVARAFEVFGGLDLVVVSAHAVAGAALEQEAKSVLTAAFARMQGRGRFLLTASPESASSAAAAIAVLRGDLGVACASEVGGGEPEDVAARVVAALRTSP